MSNPPYQTLSEKMQKQFGTKKCPRLKECTKRIAMAYFRDVCCAPKYVACIYYAMAMEEDNTPMSWLQKTVVSVEEPNFE